MIPLVPAPPSPAPPVPAPPAPAPLALGDAVYVAQIAASSDAQLLSAGIEALRARGFRVVVGDVAGPTHPYFAGPKERRLADLARALTLPEIRAVFFARGGHGALHLIDGLDDALASMPDPLRRDRWLVGYSDITALHGWGIQRGWPCLHGPMVTGFGRPEAGRSLDALIDHLTGTRQQTTFEDLQCLAPGEATGVLVGGNLSVLACLVGTRHMPRMDGSLLFVEEVGEAHYRVDRLISTLMLDDRLRGVRGIVLGDFTRCGPPEETPALLAHVASLFAPLGVPVAAGLPVGHGALHLPLRLGVPWTITCSAARASLSTSAAEQTAARMTDHGHAPGTPTPTPTSTPTPTPTPTPTVAVRTPTVTVAPAARGTRAAPQMRPAPPLSTAAEVLCEAVRDRVCSAAQLEVWRGDDLVDRVAIGTIGTTSDVEEHPITASTRFDLASLTKALSTAVLAWGAVESKCLSLDDRCPAVLSIDRPTLRDLLRHTSGLPAHVPVFEAARLDGDDAARVGERFAEIRVDPRRVGKPIYSDVGYIALGRWLEQVRGERLDHQFARNIAIPLGLTRLGYLRSDISPRETKLEDRLNHRREGNAARTDVVATEWCPWRGATLHGIVHDENAQLLDGVCGHAGLFGSAQDVATIMRSLLGDGPPLLIPSTVDHMWDRREMVAGGSHTLGWDTPSGPNSSAGTIMGRSSTFGHLGFTGTSVWACRETRLVVVLLTNRVHPSRDDQRIRGLRPRVHDLIASRVLGR